MGISLEGDNYYDTWINMVREALSCFDQEKYNWIYLPQKGGYYDQDEFFIICWEYIKYCYMDARNDAKFMESLRVKYTKGK